jgi:hypothetical protein
MLGMMNAARHVREMKRPKHLDPPAHLSPSPPIPDPALVQDDVPPAGEEQRLDPTRYGDWEKRGVAVDF